MLVLRQPIETYFKEHSASYAEPLEISHWQRLEDLVQFLSVIKTASLKMEAEDCITGSKAARVFRMLRIHLNNERQEEMKGKGAGIVPLANAMFFKLDKELDSPNWMFGMAFLAFMDPSGERLLLCKK